MSFIIHYLSMGNTFVWRLRVTNTDFFKCLWMAQLQIHRNHRRQCEKSFYMFCLYEKEKQFERERFEEDRSLSQVFIIVPLKMESNTEDKPKGLSFGFAKSMTSKPKFSIVEKVEAKDFVLDVSNGRIESSKPKEKKEVLVIPCAGNTVKLKSRVKSEIAEVDFKPSGNEEADKVTKNSKSLLTFRIYQYFFSDKIGGKAASRRSNEMAR